MHRLPTAAAFALLAGLGTAAAQDADPAILYFPVKDGMKRTYVKSQNGKAIGEFSETVTMVEQKGDVYLVTVTRDGSSGQMSGVFEVSSKGVFRIMPPPWKGDPRLALLKHSAKVGDKWLADIEGPPGSGKATVKAVILPRAEVAVEVPAGKFRAIPMYMGYEILVNKKAQAVEETSWYAPGVGVVKTVAKHPRGDLVSELKSVTLKK